LELEKGSFEKMLSFVWEGTYFTTEAAFNSSSLQKFIKEDKSHFDLIFIEHFYQPVLHMFAYKYKAPVVIMSTFGYMYDAFKVLGNPVYLSYMPHEFRKFKTPLSLFDKLINVYSAAYDTYWTKTMLYPMHQKLAEKHFSHLPQPLPDVETLIKNVSLVFLNTHYSVDTVRPSVPGVVEIGGAHIKKPKPLPAVSLELFISNSNCR
jgi:glucuronosyltransferase